MKTTLYIFSLLWFVSGVVLVLLGAMLELPVLIPPPELFPEAAGSHPVFGNLRLFVAFALSLVWVLLFCVPALLLAALAAMLNRLDRQLVSPPVAAPQRESVQAPVRKQGGGKVEPHIGNV